MPTSANRKPSGEIPLIADYQPDRIFVRRVTDVVTQQQFIRQVYELAERLPDQDYVINLCQDRYNFTLSFCAVLVNGMTNLLPPNQQAKTVLSVASDYASNHCLVDADLDIDGLTCINVSKSMGDDSETTELNVPHIPSEHIAAIAFTSGSTGKPKANIKHWRTLMGTASLLSQRLFGEAEDNLTIVATVPAQHMYGLEMSVMLPLQGREVMSSAHPFYPHDVCEVLTGIPEPRCLVTTPVHLRAITESGINMPQVNTIISATAPLEKTVALEAEAQFNGSVEEIYGCTEAGSIATRYTASDAPWKMLDGMLLSLKGEQINVSGAHLLESKSLQDRLELIDESTFRFIGRISDLVNVGGKRASLADLTNKLISIEGVNDAIVFIPQNSTKSVQRMAALVVSELTDREITEKMSSLVDPVFIPRPLRRVDALPRSDTGKIMYDVVQKMLNRDYVDN